MRVKVCTERRAKTHSAASVQQREQLLSELARTGDMLQKIESQEASIRRRKTAVKCQRRELGDRLYELDHPGAQSRAEKRAKNNVLSARYRDRRKRDKEVSVVSKLNARAQLQERKQFWASHTLYNRVEDCPKHMHVLE